VCATAAQAATVSGTVTSEGRPVRGALLTLRYADGFSDTVYTDAVGRYTLRDAREGAATLRARKRYLRDQTRDVAPGAGAEMRADFALAPITDPVELSDAHPSVSHFARIRFDSDPAAPLSRPNFARDCLSCHQLGNALTRAPRPVDGWVPSVERMHGYLGNADRALMRSRAERLAASFDGGLAASRPELPADAALDRARVRTWQLPKSVVPHDAEYSERYKRFFISEMFGGEVIEVDTERNTVEHLPLPADGAPPGGEFTRRGLAAPYQLQVPRAPHSLAEGSDGNFYLTDSIGAAITVYDPGTRGFRSHDVGGGALYPHTVRIDRKGVVWFTIAFSSQVGRFDPADGSMRVLELPDTPSKSMPAGAMPYGIDVNPVDGSVWYTKFAADRIGRVDPVTLAIREYDSPVRGPRRQRFDASGQLWVAGFAEGAIARIEVASWTAEVYPLPVLAPGEITAPYALAVNPRTQEVWVNDTMMDVAWRFLPAEERFIAYPMPLRGTYTRDFSFTPQGWACTTNNTLPAVALEGGVPQLECIDPGEPAAPPAG
jgi:streptogramin lyase